jgi:hypothetical protein
LHKSEGAFYLNGTQAKVHTTHHEMSTKHVLNDPATLVVDSLKGLAALNPDIQVDEGQRGE